MATAKGKRAPVKRAPPTKAKTTQGKRVTRKPQPMSNPSYGLGLLAVGILLMGCLITDANAPVIVFVRQLLNGVFGRLGWIFTLLVIYAGLQMAFAKHWPLSRGILPLSSTLLVLVATMLSTLEMDAMVKKMVAGGYPAIYQNAVSYGYLESRNVVRGGGLVGALLGYPLFRYLGMFGSVLLLFFAIGGGFLALIRKAVPTAGARVSGGFTSLQERFADWQENRKTDKAERAVQQKADRALLVPLPKNLREPEETEPPKKRPAPPPPAPKPIPTPAPAPKQAPIKPTKPPKLFIEDIIPDHVPFASQEPFTAEDVERVKPRNRREPEMVPDFLTKRRAQVEAAYGVLTPSEPEPEQEWTPVEPLYTPEPTPPTTARRRRVYANPLDAVPELLPEMRLDSPDYVLPVEEVPTALEPESYRQPPFSLLDRDDEHARRDTRESDARAAQKLEETLSSFGVTAHVIKVVHGPAITRYELQPAAGVKVSRIVNLQDDIALNMAAVGVRIEAPIPGKAAIGIEIANAEIETIRLRDVLESDESLRSPSRLAVALGKDIAGKRIIADLAKMPHLLIAGATGSGKSVCINTIICSIIYRATPDEVRLILIDPKKVELSVYNGIPHLLVPVVTDPKKASGALNWAVLEMDERYRLFAEVGVREIRSYNAQRPDDMPLMPQIVVVIDELSDLMLIAAAEVEDAICRLAQLARACGIHLVIATQRPSVNVITGIIKANIPSRIAFAVSSQVDSRTIMDTAGAEKLLGKGDMLYALSGGGKPIRVQGCFVSDAEVSRVVDYVKDRHTVDYSKAVIEALDAVQAENGDATADEDLNDSSGDALFSQAVEMAVESGQASISMLQRRLRVGYARAGRLIDEMAKRGIIGQAEGAKPREVLISREDIPLVLGRR